MKIVREIILCGLYACACGAYLIAGESNNSPRSEVPTEPALIRMSRESIVCVIEEKGKEHRILKGEDALRLESYLKEFENSWVSEAGFWQILEDIGCWDYPRTNELGKIRIYKNGEKLYDLRIVWLALYKPGKEKIDGQFLWLHWDEPLYDLIYHKRTEEPVAKPTERRRVDPLPWPAWNGCIRYNAEEVENGPKAQAVRLTDYINEHAESKDEAHNLMYLLYEEVQRETDERVDAFQHRRERATQINLRDHAACLALLRVKKRALQGDAQAQYELGEAYLSGAIFMEDIIGGREFIRKAAKQGHVKAEERLKELAGDARYLPYDAKIAAQQQNVKEIYDALCRELAASEVQPAAEETITEYTRIIGTRKTGGSSDEEVSMATVERALATLLRANKLDDELLCMGWDRADLPNVRIAYLLAYYLLYGDKVGSKYQKLNLYAKRSMDVEERQDEIRQVQTFIENLNAPANTTPPNSPSSTTAGIIFFRKFAFCGEVW